MRERAAASILGVILIALGCAHDATRARDDPYDLIVADARIVDGSGNPSFQGDLGIRGDRIARIGDLAGARATRRIDARRRVVAPGFIDMHSHASWLVLVDSRAASAITQGITLVVEGEGQSVAPVSDFYLAASASAFEAMGITPDWRTLGEFFDRLEANPAAVNFATYVGTSTVRELTVGIADRRASAEELREMERVVAEAMEDGALGVYSALLYVPDVFNSTEELIAMARVAARYGGAYQTHQRSEGDALRESLDEAFEIGRAAGIRVNITHLKAAYAQNWGEMPSVVDAIAAARREGVDVAADVYPYRWAWADLPTLIPPWAREGGDEAMRARLRDAATRERIKEEMETPSEAWDNEYLGAGRAQGLVILWVEEPSLKHLEGRLLADIAEEWGTDPRDVILDLILTGRVDFISNIVDEADMKLALQQPWVSFGTDGGLAAVDGPLSIGLTHPRTYGTFPRILGRYARDEGLLSLEEAVRKATSLPAQRLGIPDRGLLREGFYADLVIFDPDTIIDRSTYERPHRYSEGIEYVIVNGEVVLDRGRITGARPGRAVRGPGFVASP
jgi:N-acyl-D-amino-acid deacylase